MANADNTTNGENKMSDYTVATPEMGDTIPEDTQIEAHIGYGGWYLKTHLDLRGRGIKLASDGKDSATGRKAYFATKLAVEKLKTQYKLCSVSLLD